MKFVYKGHTLYLHKVVCLIVYKCFAQWLPISYHYGPLGRFARWFRYQLCRRIFLECGERVNVEHRANFGTGFRLRVGSCSSIGIHSKIAGNARIGDNVLMGPRCKMFVQNHNYERVDIPKWQQGMITPPQFIDIQDDVWIGEDVLICPGKTIGKCSVIGARSVVSRSIPPYSVAAGNPAEIVKQYNFEKGKWEKV
jgi:maltose O-acetyltransferase